MSRQPVVMARLRIFTPGMDVGCLRQCRRDLLEVSLRPAIRGLRLELESA